MLQAVEWLCVGTTLVQCRFVVGQPLDNTKLCAPYDGFVVVRRSYWVAIITSGHDKACLYRGLGWHTAHMWVGTLHTMTGASLSGS